MMRNKYKDKNPDQLFRGYHQKEYSYECLKSTSDLSFVPNGFGRPTSIHEFGTDCISEYSALEIWSPESDCHFLWFWNSRTSGYRNIPEFYVIKFQNWLRTCKQSYSVSICEGNISAKHLHSLKSFGKYVEKYTFHGIRSCSFISSEAHCCQN